MGFLGDLAGALNSQAGIVQNTTDTLDSVIDGQNIPYGTLGNFASQFDQSAERRYVEEGYLRVDPYETDPKQLEVLWQQPSATILVRKKMFSSVSENFRPDFMDGDEKIYYNAMNVLFQNKCTQIAALEQLGKIQQVTSAVGNISQQLVPTILTLADIINNGYGSGLQGITGLNSTTSSQDVTNFLKVADRLRVVNTYNQTAQYTTWINNPTSLYQSSLGNGTGVIEITNFTKLDTNCCIDLNSKCAFGFSIADPYEAMLITDWDIEKALSDSTNAFYNNKAYQISANTAQQNITNQQTNFNNIRNGRNASPVSFMVNPNAIFGQKVTVIIDRIGTEIPFVYDPGFLGIGASVTIPPDYLRGGAIAGYDGIDDDSTPIAGLNANFTNLISPSEASLFQGIILAIFAQLTMMNSSSNNAISNTKALNYARRKLRFNFSGKLIIQPMDVVNIYINTRSQTDNKILAGLQQMFTGVGILQDYNNTNTALNTLFSPADNTALQAEKSAYVGPDFPNDLWGLVRTQFVTEIEGTHVFGGVVTEAHDSWQGGQFTMNIRGQDNTYYFEQGKINFKPGADAFNGLYFDPLTPFESSFDAVTTNNSPVSLELLDENKYLLSDTASGSMVKYKLGALAGEKATTGNYIQDQSYDPVTRRQTRNFYAPDGLAYKWKQGISIFTQTGSNTSINDPTLVGQPNLYQEPFAGLDVMNVISLLVTGVPYNYQTFYQNTANIQGISGDPLSKQGASQSYIGALTASLKKNNTLWGNFIPFKSLVMTEAAIASNLQAQNSINNANSDLDSKIQQFATLQYQLTALGAVNALSPAVQDSSNSAVSAQFTNLQAQVSNLTGSINSALNDVQAATQSLFQQINTATAYTNNALTDGANDPSDTASRELLRKQINYLTRRMSYDVRANDDKNLFIVDDYYDSDYDIAAFNQALSDGIPLYSYDFTSVLEKLSAASSVLDIEVFCDTQGHIRARPPHYNNMPSSIFFRMLWLKQTTGLQIFPQFLSKLFTDQLTALKTQIEIVEDQIRLECAILGQYPSLDATGDNTAENFISSANVTGGMSVNFNFISDSTDNITDIPDLISQANQEEESDTVGQGLSDYDNIVNSATSTKPTFGNSQRYVVLFQALQAQLTTQLGINTNSAPSTNVFAQGSVVQQIITRLNAKSGQTISSQDYLTQAGPNQPLIVGSGQTIDLFKVTNDLMNYMQTWQMAVKAFYHTVKNAAEYQALDDDDSTTNQMVTPYSTSNTGNSYIPEVYQHMIEDETYDDYGPGSGGRYIIHNYQILSLEVSENPPACTSVEIQGTLSPNLIPASGQNGGLNSFPGGGNSLCTALAVDYDMWRNYGFKNPSVMKVPFLTDPDTQCGPFAAVILSRNRANILRASCTIMGNEYMQPGEVVYLETRSLLFYVHRVTHNYVEGKSFTTSLDLIYGHSIGDYIPSYFDAIGKMICKNQSTIDTIIHRQDSSAPEQPLGVVQLDAQNAGSPILYTGSEDSNINAYSDTNQTVVNNILYQTSFTVAQNGAAGNNMTAAIELRIYNDNKISNTIPESTLFQLVSALTGTNQGPQTAPGSNQPSLPPPLPASVVNVVTINIDDETDRRSPSQQAIDAARNQLANASTNDGNPDPSLPANNNDLRTLLFSYIIDCWITFTQVPDTIASGTSAT